MERADEIARFVPKPFWYLGASVDCNGVPIQLNWKKSRSFERKVVLELQQKLAKGKTALVSSIVVKAKKKVRPLGLNTVNLLIFGSKNLGMRFVTLFF